MSLFSEIPKLNPNLDVATATAAPVGAMHTTEHSNEGPGDANANTIMDADVATASTMHTIDCSIEAPNVASALNAKEDTAPTNIWIDDKSHAPIRSVFHVKLFLASKLKRSASLVTVVMTIIMDILQIPTGIQMRASMIIIQIVMMTKALIASVVTLYLIKAMITTIVLKLIKTMTTLSASLT